VKQLRLLNVMRDYADRSPRQSSRRHHPACVEGRASTAGRRPWTIWKITRSCSFSPGLDTVVNGASFLMLHLAQNPALQEELRANPKIVPEAVEEMLRRYTFYGAGAQRRQGRRLRGHDDEGR